MSTKLSILATSFLLPMMTLQAATESSVTASFRIEVLVHKVASAPASIPVECLYGCAWDKQTIECPAAIKECRAIIDGRFGIEPWTKEAVGVQTVLPWSGTVCLGVATLNAQSAAERGFSEPDRSAAAGAIAWQVDAGSPAAVAGIKTGDLFTGFNGASVKRPEDLYDTVKHMKAGQPFETTLNRHGIEIQVSGHLGILTTAGCRPADPQLLAMPAAETLPITPFSIAIDDLKIPIELRCLEGCDSSHPVPIDCSSTQSCSFTFTQQERADR